MKRMNAAARGMPGVKGVAGAMTWVAVALTIFGCASPSGERGLKYGDCGDPVFDGQLYTTDDQFNAFCEELAARYPDLVRIGEIGRSAENRRITLLTVTDFAHGGEDKPGYFIQGNIHSKELSTWAASLHVARRLCEDHRAGGLLSKMVFYIVPRCNPDGAERMTVTPANERSGWQRELPPDEPNQFVTCDVNGDGVISKMRFKDPTGPLVVSPWHRTCMRSHRRGTAGQQRYRVMMEGVVRNWDGTRRYGFRDAVDLLDMNRMWGPGWKGYGKEHRGVAEPFSAPEVKSQADWLLAHKNIRGAICFHNGYESIMSPPVRKEDEERVTRLGKLGEKIMNIPYMTEKASDAKVDGGIVVAGRFSEFCYDRMGGILCFVIELGTMENSGGAATHDLMGRPNVYDEPVEVCRMQDEHPEIRQGFMDWKPFDHPQFGEVEIGGYQGSTFACPLPIDARRRAEGSYRFVCALAEDILK